MVTKHRADLPVLCGCFLLAIYFMFGSVYMSTPLFHFVTACLSPSSLTLSLASSLFAWNLLKSRDCMYVLFTLNPQGLALPSTRGPHSGEQRAWPHLGDVSSRKVDQVGV